jgi:hypothetical protein
MLTGLQLGNSSYYVEHKSNALGPFMPILQQEASNSLPGGGWIAPAHGWHNSPIELQMCNIRAGGMMDRERICSFSPNGNPLTPEDWLDNGDQIFAYTEDLGTDNNSINHPKYERLRNASSACSYESSLYDYQYIYASHKSRTTLHSETLAWLSNDELAKDILRMHGANTRMAATHYTILNGGTSAIAGTVTYKTGGADGLGNGWLWRDDGTSNSHKSMTRRDSWIINTISNALAFESNPTTRGYFNEWGEAMAEVYRLAGHGSKGLLLRDSGNLLSQASTAATAADPALEPYDIIKTFEHNLILIGLRGLLDRFELSASTKRQLTSIYRRSVYNWVINSPLYHFGAVAEYVTPPHDRDWETIRIYQAIL